MESLLGQPHKEPGLIYAEDVADDEGLRGAASRHLVFVLLLVSMYQ